MRKQLVATRPMRYGTRRLVPGDIFDASGRDARILMGIGKAEEYTPPPPLEPDPEPEKDPDPEKEPEVDTLAEARQEYIALVGKRPGPMWDEATIREKMAEYDESEED